ncbi:MAG: peptidase M20 [Deltaproteobacteria bacterium]|nr:MAG: peptidase M20 [Deltaproteobacteria bacterium]
MNNDWQYKGPFENEQDFFKWLTSLRRWIHQHAELSYQEFQTAGFVRQRLDELGISQVEMVGETGIKAVIDGKDSKLPKAALRADMDALPIEEGTGLSFSSINRGVMHACGHDGHTAMLLGAIYLLQQDQQPPADIVCMFQPAEEHGNGAKMMVENGVLEGVGAVFGGHLDPHFATGQITVDEGIICAFADQFQIKVKGRGGHAARPHESIDALVAASALVGNLQSLVSREVDPNHAAVITIGSFHAGTAPNVIAEEAVLDGTVRTTDIATRERVLGGLKRMVDSAASMYGVKTELIMIDALPAVINTKPAADIARQAALKVAGPDGVISQGKSSLGGEDFAFYQQQVSGCMVRYGAALPGAGVAHSNTFDFDEQALLIGAKWLAAAARLYLGGLR